MSVTYLNLIAYTTDLEVELDCTICDIWLWGEIDASHWYLTAQSHEVQPCVTIFVLHLIFCFCRGLKMMGSDKICTASCTYVHVLSLCHL
jgi:hypothetical protein